MNKVCTLLLDLALPGARIAIRDGNTVLAAQETDRNSSGSDEMLSILDQLLRSRNISKNDLHEVICTRGPGGYTGIRVMLSFVQGLKRALQIDAHAYPIFDALLYGGEKSTKAAAIDAGRNELLCSIPAQSHGEPFFASRSEIPPILKKHGVEKLVLSSTFFGEIESSLNNDVAVISASDNVLNLLFDFHNSGEGTGKDNLRPIYGRELLHRPEGL